MAMYHNNLAAERCFCIFGQHTAVWALPCNTQAQSMDKRELESLSSGDTQHWIRLKNRQKKGFRLLSDSRIYHPFQQLAPLCRPRRTIGRISLCLHATWLAQQLPIPALDRVTPFATSACCTCEPLQFHNSSLTT